MAAIPDRPPRGSSDLIDVLAYVANAAEPVPRTERAKVVVDQRFHDEKAVFLHFVLSHYVDLVVGELDRDKLSPLLRLKYGNSLQDAVQKVVADIGEDFRDFQRYLYEHSEPA